jgi:hypothetical protein
MSDELQLLKTIIVNQQRMLMVFGAQITEITALQNSIIQLLKGQSSHSMGLPIKEVSSMVETVLNKNREAAEQSSLDLHQKFEASESDKPFH